MKQNYASSYPLLKESAEAGNPISQNMLGLLYRDGYGGVKKNVALAEEWFLKAAKQNDLKSQSNLARLMGVESDRCTRRKEALTWLLIAADQGDVSAKKMLAVIEPDLSAALLLEAKKAASRFILLQRAKAGQAKKETSPASSGETQSSTDS
jgi:TPR repeat protein